MVQLVTRRSALVLYGVLLVLPTVVFGGLLWLQLEEDHRTQMAAIPGSTQDAARRLSEALERRIEDLIQRESQRPFYVYKQVYFQPGTIGTELALSPSPLATGPAPEGILAWFNCRFKNYQSTPTEIEIFSGGKDVQPGWAERRADLQRATAQLVRHDLGEARENFLSYFRRMGAVRIDKLALPVAAINASQEEDIECLANELPALRGLQDEVQNIQVYSFYCRFYRDENGIPRVLGARSVIIGKNARLREMPPCWENIESGVRMVQGFYLDPEWLFEKLPSGLASQILDSSQQFFVSGATTGRESPPLSRIQAGSVQAEIRPIKELGFETYAKDDENYGLLRVVVNPHVLEDRYRTQRLHLLGVAAMLVLSLGTGLALLLRSVRRDLEAAQRTENFVAAITHELRTPLSAIRMHGEMLQDGWIRDDTKRSEYYRRIVRETNRLETLVERVLEKSRLATSSARPEPGDLNSIIQSLEPSLLGSKGSDPTVDVVFDLSPDLPDALLVPEGVRSIVTNLVENARKYAPVQSAGANGAEPIRVATLSLNGDPVLEVRDRGPGIPREERSRVFDAFYRIGNESTRTTKGTGLGLHLVALHCQTMDAEVQVLDREGGGTVFRVTFERAEDGVHPHP